MDKAKEFKKGWEQYQSEKKKQIEEMAKEIFNTCAWRFGNPNDYKEVFNDIAEDLTKLNYQKIDKDSVVLTEREFLDNCELNYDKGYKKGSKETAEKFKTSAIKVINQYRNCDLIDAERLVFELNNIAKQLGVEIKE